jgi:hypothetical protein
LVCFLLCLNFVSSCCRCLKCFQLCFVIPITISLETDFLFFFISIGIESLDGRVVKVVDSWP